MIKWIAFSIAFLVLFSSCEKDSPDTTKYGGLEIVFKARYGQEALVYGAEYDYFGLGKIIFGTTDFYISSLKLLNSSDTVLIKDVDYISLMTHHTTTALADGGLLLSYSKIPAGVYQTVNFNMGITPEQNASKPVNFNSGHPLGDGSRYWDAWNSYIFTKTEGTLKSNKLYNFTYHSGFDNSLRSLSYSRNVLIGENETSRIEISIDYQKMFEDGLNPMDISSISQIHNQSPIMLRFVDRFQNAVSIK